MVNRQSSPGYSPIVSVFGSAGLGSITLGSTGFVWVDIGVIPLLNLVIALIVAGLVVVIIGENPFQALGIMLDGAMGSLKGWSYMTYYATNFIFTGLAVAVAFHAGLFNIGGEG
ncbi:MAG: hypothetical protein ABI707_13680, partial [Ferruginibacter sp.]